MWRLMLLVDTDEAGAAHAVQAAKDMLRDLHPDIKSITVRDDLYRIATTPPPPPLTRVTQKAEHTEPAVNGHRRNHK